MHISSLLVLGLGAVASAQTVYLIRHGEKPADGSAGLDPQGEQRAQCLRNVFGAASSYDIGYIIAEDYKKSGSEDRPYETVEPLVSFPVQLISGSC